MEVSTNLALEVFPDVLAAPRGKGRDASVYFSFFTRWPPALEDGSGAGSTIFKVVVY